VNTLEQNEKIINCNSPLFEEVVMDEVPSDLNFNYNWTPCISASDVNCCGTASPSSITINPCVISDNRDIQAELNCQGRLLTIRVILKCVCPNKKIAVGVILFEGNKVRGFEVKEVVTPPLPTGFPGGNCEHVVVCKFCFVLSGSICCPLTLTPKIIAHYTDFNIEPCSTVCPTGLPMTSCC
jgi:hypothetical protein